MSEEVTPPKLKKDWSPDYFPTSAKPVFRSAVLLVLTIIGLCLLAAWCTQGDEVDTANEQVEKKEQLKEQLKENLMVEQDEIEDQDEKILQQQLEERDADFIKQETGKDDGSSPRDLKASIEEQQQELEKQMKQ